MQKQIDNAAISVLLAHVRQILAPNSKVWGVSASPLGVGFYLDSPSGERDEDIVHFSCTPTDPEMGQAEGGWNVLARLADGQFVGEWIAQGESLEADYHACWLAIMANRSGRGDYWLMPLFIEEA